MPIALHHMIVPVFDRDAATAWFADLLELREPWENGFFQSFQLDDHLVLDLAAAPARRATASGVPHRRGALRPHPGPLRRRRDAVHR